MSWLRKTAIILVSLAILIGAVLGILVLGFDRETLRTTLEDRLASATGLQVEVRGAVERHWLPPGLSVFGLRLHDGDREILAAKQVQGRLALRPLLHRELRLASLTLHEPRLTLQKGLQESLFPDGVTPETGRFAFRRMRVRNGLLRYAGASGEVRVELEELALDMARPARGGRISGQFHAGRLRMYGVEIRGLNGSLAGTGQRYRIEPLQGELYGSPVQGSLTLDLNGPHPDWRVRLHAPALPLAGLFRPQDGKLLYEGSVDMQTTVSGIYRQDWIGSLDGTLRLSGTDLVQHGFDIDRFIQRMRESRNIDPLDIGILAFAGPMGVLLSQGIDVARMAHIYQQEYRQPIEQLVFNWSLQDGMAHTEDVAFRTPENRLALKGAIDLGQLRYQDMTLGLLNKEGCAELTEEISGPLTKPVVEKSGMLSTLFDSLLGVFRQGWEYIDHSDCQPFYEGAVAHPGTP